MRLPPTGKDGSAPPASEHCRLREPAIHGRAWRPDVSLFVRSLTVSVSRCMKDLNRLSRVHVATEVLQSRVRLNGHDAAAGAERLRTTQRRREAGAKRRAAPQSLGERRPARHGKGVGGADGFDTAQT